MIQRQRSHPEKTFPICKDCAREPRHFVIGGASYSSGQSPEKHMLECRCHCTGKFNNSDDAIREWRQVFAVAQRSDGVLSLKRSVSK